MLSGSSVLGVTCTVCARLGLLVVQDVVVQDLVVRDLEEESSCWVVLVNCLLGLELVLLWHNLYLDFERSLWHRWPYLYVDSYAV